MVVVILKGYFKAYNFIKITLSYRENIGFLGGETERVEYFEY